MTVRFLNLYVAAVALCSLIFGIAARADDDLNHLRLGIERVVLHDSDSGFRGPGIPAGLYLGTKTEDFSTVYLSYARDLTRHLELELIAGIPPTFHVHARGPASLGAVPYAGTPLTSGKEMAPAFTLNYKFNEPGAFYRPYVGVGLVYAHFYDLQDTSGTDAINGGPTRIHFTDSFGLVEVAGVSLRLMDHLYGQLGVTHADVRPDVTVQTAGVTRLNHVDLNPLVFTAAFSYGF